MFVELDGEARGIIAVADQVKPEAEEALKKLLEKFPYDSFSFQEIKHIQERSCCSEPETTGNAIVVKVALPLASPVRSTFVSDPCRSKSAARLQALRRSHALY